MRPFVVAFAWLAPQGIAPAATIAFIAMLALACIADVRARRIPNGVVVAILFAGLLVAALHDDPGHALLSSLGGVAVGFIVWIPFYLLHMLGAGDVKLFAAASAWLSPTGALAAAVVAALVGGVLSLAMMLAGQGVRMTMLRLGMALRDPAALQVTPAGRAARVPYALAMAAGVLVALYRPELL